MLSRRTYQTNHSEMSSRGHTQADDLRHYSSGSPLERSFTMTSIRHSTHQCLNYLYLKTATGERSMACQIDNIQYCTSNGISIQTSNVSLSIGDLLDADP